MKGQRPMTQMGDPWRGLAAAVLLQAARDARAGDPEALQWLAEDGPLYLDGIGMDVGPEAIASWVKRGCPFARLGQPPPYRIAIRIIEPQMA